MSSSQVVIRVEGLSKQYRLGVIGTGTISHDLNRWWAKIRGKNDPYLKVGEVNGRDKTGSHDYVWALQDVSFQVNQGHVLGIIGANGAGKSTLLKILSRVTGPTSGDIKVRGKIASLLEVGTGFHPELTGRENLFLNGAILGMTRSEIKKKFDEIVDFSGVEQYIDTPVKRYSSGMYVRLAFAVAAHLEPEILIVDEVLAVGDVEFQKKCLGKMKDVAGEGRTVMFVSHNMAAMRNLCPQAMLLEKGRIAFSGNTDECVDRYFNISASTQETRFVGDALNNKSTEYSPTGEKYFTCDEIVLVDVNNKEKTLFNSDEEIKIGIKYSNLMEVPMLNIVVQITSEEDVPIVRIESQDDGQFESLFPQPAGNYECECIIPKNMFAEKRFYIHVTLMYHGVHHIAFQKLLSFNVNFRGYNHSNHNVHSKSGAYIRPKSIWNNRVIKSGN